MVVVNADMSISLTRGDRVTFTVTAEKDGQDYVFQPGDLLRMKVFEKKDCEAVVLQKDFPVSEATGEVGMTLEAQDREFHPFYGGPMEERDMAYHQGTVWVFPLGAYYLAYLKVHDYSEEAKRTVKEQLETLEPALREGCIGQLPEIYDGENPVSSKGCFAQAWSVGEILRVYEALEKEG